MKSPLRYQMSEYDCGPTTMLNGISYLFPRESISPEIIRNIMLYSLDSYGGEGIMGKRGTSSAAMMFLSNWLNGYGKIGDFHIAQPGIFREKTFILARAVLSMIPCIGAVLWCCVSFLTGDIMSF